ncbi:MAG: hypothetical protein H6634_15500 [Anaerolineales bacterium]|nr:hypothetical protein [Anaerolineales bacterium]
MHMVAEHILKSKGASTELISPSRSTAGLEISSAKCMEDDRRVHPNRSAVVEKKVETL